MLLFYQPQHLYVTLLQKARNLMAAENRPIQNVAVLVILFAMMLTVFGLFALPNRSNTAAVSRSSLDIGDVQGKETPLTGMSSLLDGWTFQDDTGAAITSQGVGNILIRYGAQEAKTGQIPDIKVSLASASDVVWIHYRGKNQFFDFGMPEWQPRVSQIVLDMAITRLRELKESNNKKLALK
jgi:hypothetical protein